MDDYCGRNGEKIMKYYYLLIDKLEKTISLREYEYESCDAKEMKKIQVEYGLQNFHTWQLDSRFKICFNDTKDYIDYEILCKYARKYKVI